MKVLGKILIILIFNLFIGFNCFSQYKFGVQGGYGRSNYIGTDFIKSNSIPKEGITAGLFFEREINLTLSFGFELNYDKKGTFYNFYPQKATTISVDSRLTYMNLPVYIKAYFGKRAIFYIYLGASAAYLKDFQSTDKATEYGFEVSSTPYFHYTYNPLDASMVGGCGFNLYKFILDFRYNYGVVNVYKGDNSLDIRNSFLNVTLGYTIYQKKVVSCFKNRAY